MSDNLAADPLPNFAGVWQTMANGTDQIGQFGLNFDLKQNDSAISGTFTSSVIQGNFTATVSVIAGNPSFAGTGTLEYSGSSMDCRVSGTFVPPDPTFGGGTTFGGNLMGGDGQIVSLAFMTPPSDEAAAETSRLAPPGRHKVVEDEAVKDDDAPAPTALTSFCGEWTITQLIGFGSGVGQSHLNINMDQIGNRVAGMFSAYDPGNGGSPAESLYGSFTATMGTGGLGFQGTGSCQYSNFNMPVKIFCEIRGNGTISGGINAGGPQMSINIAFSTDPNYQPVPLSADIKMEIDELFAGI